MAAALAYSLMIVTGATGMRNATVSAAQLALMLCGLIGYIMLLCKRRVGLYMILIGAGALLGAQFASSLSVVIVGGGNQLVTLISSIVGACNPLFAYLAERAGEPAAR